MPVWSRARLFLKTIRTCRPEGQTKRNKKIAEAVEKYGYTRRAIADHCEMHFTHVRQIMNKEI
ncbi:MAG: hypothetical protein M0Z89_07665 [Nitrospiraceae bacterium]|nr:hypothetical protein [Nitrospiraceae bacterium]